MSHGVALGRQRQRGLVRLASGNLHVADGLTMTHGPEPSPGRVEIPDDRQRHASAWWAGRPGR